MKIVQKIALVFTFYLIVGQTTVIHSDISPETAKRLHERHPPTDFKRMRDATIRATLTQAKGEAATQNKPKHESTSVTEEKK